MTQKEFIGKNSLNNIKSIIDKKIIQRVLVFSGKKSFKFLEIDRLISKNFQNIDYKYILKKNILPNLEDLEYFISSIITFKPDLIIAIGGGGVLDLAKISNSMYGNSNLDINIKKKNYTLKKKYCPLVAIPTTAGSGAEVTSNAVLYIEKIKYSVESKFICPDYVIIDPDLITRAPRIVSITSGLDAIVQAVESLLSKRSTNDSVEFSKKSLFYTLNYFENHINNQTFDTSYNMSMGALFSGKAINISKTTAPHALSYPFTSYFGITHGHAVCLTFLDILKFNYKNINKSKVDFDLKDRFNIIFKSFKVSSIEELDQKFKNILKNVGLSLNFKDLKIINEDQISLVLNNINFDRLSNNPVEIQTSKIRDILLKKL